MKLKTVCLFCLLTLFSSFGRAQTNLELLFNIDTPGTYVTTDNLDNVYVVTEKNLLLKYNAAGKLLWNYSNKAFGKLAFIDATDPMRLLLFYQEAQQAVILNNNLSEITRFDFGKDPSKFITLVTTANSNGYWTFNQLKRRLEKLGNRFEEELVSGDLFQQTAAATTPQDLKTNDQQVFLALPPDQILQFDRFGAYVRIIKVEATKCLQVKNNEILFLYGNVWKSLNLAGSAIRTLFSFSEKPDVVSQGTKLVVTLTGKKIRVYSIPPAVKSRE